MGDEAFDLVTRERCRSAGLDPADVLAALIEVLASARLPVGDPADQTPDGLPLLAAASDAAAALSALHRSKSDDLLCELLRDRAVRCDTVVDLDLGE